MTEKTPQLPVNQPDGEQSRPFHPARDAQKGSVNQRVTVIGRAVHISDLDDEDRMMLDNARNVLEHSAELLGSPGATLRECRFTANELMRSLRNLLDLIEP